MYHLLLTSILFPSILLIFLRYGPLMIPMATFLGLAAYSSAHTPLRELVPWMPVGLSTLLLLTAYSLPRFWPNFEGYAPVDRQISLEDGLFQPPVGSNEAILDSSQAFESPRSDHGSSSRIALCEQGSRELQVSHMSRSTSPSSRLLSVHDSDIDLDEPTPYPFAQWVSYPTARILRNLPQTVSQSESQVTGIPMVSIRSCRDCPANDEASHSGNDQRSQRSSSPGSQAGQCDSTSARSEMALLGQNVPGSFTTP